MKIHHTKFYPFLLYSKKKLGITNPTPLKNNLVLEISKPKGYTEVGL
jgi:hypothetical protein